LVFLDEPFQALDPINVERVKALIKALHHEGKTIVLSSHRMNLVEVLCDRVLLIHRGRSVLYGPLTEIKREYAPNTIRVRADRIPPDLPGVAAVEPDDGAFNLELADEITPEAVLRGLLEREVKIQAFEVAPVPLEDIFLTVVNDEEASDGLA
jgi:ABC-2 type transport system ATP-binding protein